MANPVLTQAEFDEIFNRLLEGMNWYATLRETWRRFAENKVRGIELNDVNGFTSNFVFTSFDVTSMLDEFLYIRILDETPGAAQAEVTLFRATGGGLGDEVAQGDGADSTTITLTERNSSGIAGTVDIGVVSIGETDDSHRLRMFPDFPQRVASVFDDTEPEDAGQDGIRVGAETALDTIQIGLKSQMDVAKSHTADILSDYVAKKISAQSETPALLAVIETGTDGAVIETFSGIVAEFRKAMIDNTTVQTVAERVMAAGAAVFQTGNRGVGSFGGITLRPYARAGTLIGRCTDDTFGQEKFTMTFRPTDNGGIDLNDDTITGETVLTVDGLWSSPLLGVQSMTLSRSWTKAADGGNTEYATAPNFSATGENATNTVDGVVQMVVTGASPNFVVTVYSDAAATQAVAVTSATLSANDPFTAVPTGGSGLTVIGTLGSAPVGTQVEFDMEPFKADSEMDNQPDQFDIPITQTTDALIQDVWGETLGFELNETTLASETIPDGRLRRGGINTGILIMES